MSVNYYRLFCVVEQIFVYCWGVSEPTVCPNNSEHTSITNCSILDTVSKQEVLIQQDIGTTQGMYRAESKCIQVPANTTVDSDYTWPFDINVSRVFFNTLETHTNDVINTYIAPDTTIGVLVSSVVTGANTFIVSGTEYLKKGYLIKIGTEELGQAITINQTNGTITTESPTTVDLTPGSLVKISVNNIRNFIIGAPGNTRFQSSGSNSAVIPAGTVVRLRYQNNSSDAKEFHFGYEYLY
jgi:hypothetical protein